MQAVARPPGQQAPVKIYNAVYSSVQVYECMVRGIAVMRRRTDSYVNATQILKVAGVDKGRRTKILEKEILPGKHEIVQGGYGKYQGTWIPLERGRDIAVQYGVAPLLAPLFDFVPNANPLGSLAAGLGNIAGSGLAPPPIMPGSALRLLNQGRAQGLFTPSTSGAYVQYPGAPAVSPTPPPPSLKRTRSDVEPDASAPSPGPSAQSAPPALAASPEIQMADRSRPSSTTSQLDGNPSPTKRARIEPSPIQSDMMQHGPQAGPSGAEPSSRPSPPTGMNGFSRPSSSQSVKMNGRPVEPQVEEDVLTIRFATKPYIPRTSDASAPLRDTRRAAIVNAICKSDDPLPIIEQIRDIAPDNPALNFDIDLVLDDQGHTALHIAASMARHAIVNALLMNGADMHRGNYNGETALVRACLATHNADQQTFQVLVAALHASIRTLDSSRKSVLHHIVASAGVKGRALAARYYLDQIFYWIAQHQGGDFRSIVDLQDEHGDTALNIAARVGNRSLVRTLLDVGANRILPNKLGLRPGDFGVETEELGVGLRADDILNSLRSAPSAPVQKSQDVLADMTTMITNLGNDFASEIKTKQDALDVTQAHLRAATRELSEQRKQIQSWTVRVGETDQVNQRIRNLEKALEEEDKFDWTGRTELDGSDAGNVVGNAFRMRGQASTISGLAGQVDLGFSLDADPIIPMSDTVSSIIRLRRLKMWHERTERLMEERLRSLQGASAEKEYQCKKIVALCTGVPVDKVEDMLDNLLVAVESESTVIDIGRVSGFMQKVKNTA
ncbi:apses-domain-containing protein [Laetiporus sulphureus 93-53]|uniref:Apses-domain-containing protein n=1 Tax=Laetiporus sulphureus 93-53 TaxID=1314785 RepID=A0A165G7R2_9APHY|nr:apses-domain-containing protein [Laetiporus sulphureus 93-53]KZT09943.1 apses-domain-containing protein [Laetiporus sulphureus 93-53]